MEELFGAAAAAAPQGPAAVKSKVWQLYAFEGWVKQVLIYEIVEPGDRVLDLASGDGRDIGKWSRAKIGHYTEALQETLTAARERWIAKGKPFPAEFHHISLGRDRIADLFPPETIPDFDVVACFKGIPQYFCDEATARQFFQNATSRLKKGGFFFGILPDSAEIWHRAQKYLMSDKHPSGTGVNIKKELYSLKFENDEFTKFGTKYTLTLGNEHKKKEYLIHFPSFIRLAGEVGLTLIDATNFAEFYEDHKVTHSSFLKSLGTLDKKGKIHPHQMEIIALYTTFVFQKVE